MIFPARFIRYQWFAIVGLTLLTNLTGCQQLSQGLRANPVKAGPSATPSPTLRREAQSPSADPLIPPPAPPSDSARRGLIDNFDSLVDREVASNEAVEFFSAEISAPPHSMERARIDTVRRAEVARTAAERRDWERQQNLPVITPGKSRLQRVSGQAPALLPVPR